MNLTSLIGKEVLYSILAWERDKFMPNPYKATVSAVDGTMVLMTNNRTYPGNNSVKDTWVNTSSLHLVFIQSV